MTQLSRAALLGIAKEATVGTWVAPTAWIPFTKASFEDAFTPIKDTSIRGNDTVMQGLYQGVVHAEWSIDVMAYPDITGHFLRGVIGPDTVTAGVSTTLSAATTAGATTITTAATIAAQSYIQIDTGANLEYARVTAVSGVGPFTLTVTGAGASGGLLFAHASAVAVVSQTTHVFKQNAAAAKATYSLTVYDTTQWLSYSDAVFSDIGIKVDPKGVVTLAAKLMTFPYVIQSPQTAAFTNPDPILGWEWNMTNGGAASTRGLTYDLNIKRGIDVIHSSDGIQAPREIFQGALEATGTYKAIFENQLDMNLYTQYTQSPTTATFVQPISRGAAGLALTLSKSGYEKGKREWGSNYVEASFTIDGLYNATDGGAVQATLTNFVTSSY